MRKVIKLIINPFLKSYFHLKLKSFVNKNKSNSFLVLDIDNTIADTWKYIENYKKNRYHFFKNIPPLEGTIQYIKKEYSSIPIIFLSNRNIIDFQVTIDWLISEGFETKESLLILTNNPVDKISYLKYLTDNFDITYFDDLSYNHENGEVLFYNVVINELDKMKIDYFGYEYLNKLNSN
jgi:hypothetical protein